MNKLLLIFGVLLFSCSSRPVSTEELAEGTFIFQDLDCGPLCDAIESVTPGLNGRHFSHVGLVQKVEDSTVVVEAISAGGVVRTPLQQFLSRVSDPSALVYMQLSPKHHNILPEAFAYIDSVMGTPYDDSYLMNNGKYYCSELLYDAFKFANAGKPFFQLHPMTFKQPGTPTYDPAWIAYYQELGEAIPEGQLGCNPGGLASGGKLELLAVEPFQP